MEVTNPLIPFVEGIADAIRYAEGSSGLIDAPDYEERIKALAGGGGGTVYPVNLVFLFANANPSNAEGSIALQTFDEDYFGSYKLYWANADGIMTNYSAINAITELTLSESGAITFQKFNEYNAIPKYATKVVCVKSTDELLTVCGEYNIPTEKLWNAGNFGNHDYSVGVLSDVHYQYSTGDDDWETAFEWCADRESCSGIVIAGDLTSDGKQSQLNEWKTARDSVRGSKPVYSCSGNHEAKTSSSLFVTDANALRPYLDTDTNEAGLPYFYKTIGNDVFVFVSCFDTETAQGIGNTMFSSEQLSWLEGILETYRNQRVFLFEHVFPYTEVSYNNFQYFGNASNAYAYNIWGKHALWRDDRTAFLELMAHYKNVIWFSGHSHLKYMLQEYQNGLYQNVWRYNTDGARLVHVSSLTVPKDIVDGSATDGLYAESEGTVMDVYPNHIILRSRDFIGGKYIGIAQYMLDTTPVTIPPSTRTLESISANKTKTEYYTDETFSTADVTVTATYDNSSTANVTASATIGTVDITTTGTKTLNISYTENDVTKTTSISIVVTERPAQKELASITSVLAGTYTTNNVISDVTSNITTTAHYSDDSTATVIGTYDTSGVTMSTAGTYSIGVSYTEDGITKTTTVSLTVTQGSAINPTVILDATFSGNLTSASKHSAPTQAIIGTIHNTNYVGVDASAYIGKKLYVRVIDGTGLDSANGVGAVVKKYKALVGGTNAARTDRIDSSTWTECYVEGTTDDLMADSTNYYLSIFMGSSSTATASFPITASGRVQVGYVDDTPPTKTLTSITATKTKTTYEQNEVFSTSDVVVTAHYSDNTTATVTASATIGTVDTSTAGNKNLNISYSEDGITKTTAIAITVEAGGGETGTITLSWVEGVKADTTTGVETSDSAYAMSDRHEVPSGQTVTYNISASFTTTTALPKVKFFWYDANGDFLSASVLNDISGSGKTSSSVEAVANAKYFKLRLNNTASLTDSCNGISLECIAGGASIPLTITEKLKIDSSTGEETAESNYLASQYIPITSGKTYTLYNETGIAKTTIPSIKICYYSGNTSNDFISCDASNVIEGTTTPTAVITPVSGATHIRLRIYASQTYHSAIVNDGLRLVEN